MRKTFLGSIAALFAMGILPTFAQNTTYFASHPSLSPDGSVAYFSYDGDLWKVNSQGGEASRITALQGEEINPKISPDGKWLAFSSNQYGNYDVFVMPTAGGAIKQLTFHQGSDTVESWGWDNETIYFTSNRHRNFASFSISRTGGTEKNLFENYFNNTHALVETKVGEYIFNNSPESLSQAYRKRYKGENNPDILGYNPKTKQFKQYTTYQGKDFYPTVDQQGQIYFASDQGNGEYNLSTLNNGKTEMLTHFETSIKRPSVSANGNKIIFEKDYQLFLYDKVSKQTKPILFTVNSNERLDKAQGFKVGSNISYFDISPDGKKIVLVSRGQLFVSDISGKFIQPVFQGSERVMEVKWMKDNKTLVFNQTANGYQNWFTMDVTSDKKDVKQLTFDERNNREIVFNHKGDQAVYYSGRDEVRLLDLKSMKSTTIVTDELWGFQNSSPSFSPNDEYVMFSAKRNFELDIFVHHIKTNKTINLTNTGVSEEDPAWSADGKYIYYAGNRTQPSYPFGSQNSSVYRIALDWYSDAFKGDKFTDLFTAEKQLKKEEKKEEKEAMKAITINTDGLLDRIELISDRFGTQSRPLAFEHKKKNYIFYSSNQNNGKREFYRTVIDDFEKNKTELAYSGSVYQMVKNDDKYFFLSGGDLYTYAIDGNKSEKISVDYSFNKNLSEEFKQMFDEMWAGVEENFYDENFHQTDWKKQKEAYKAYLPFVTNRNDLRVLLNDLLGELNASHLGFSSQGKEESTYLTYTTNETGILFQNDKPYQIERVVRKSNAYPFVNTLEKGDVLVKVNGEKVDQTKNRETYFTTPSQMEELELEFQRGNKTFTTKIHPMNFMALKQNLYDEWILNNRKKVDQLGNNRIAYSYMKNMSTGELETFLLDMVAQENNKEAVILDLRYNTGGNVHDPVLSFLSQKPYLKWKYRGGTLSTQGHFSPAGKPIVLLINEGSLSDAEMTAAGFKELKLGKVIGTETYRWIIFTSGKSLVDGSFYRIPAWGTYTLDGKNLELTGVAPDIYIKNTFIDRLTDKDPQLERAVEEILKQLVQ